MSNEEVLVKVGVDDAVVADVVGSFDDVSVGLSEEEVVGVGVLFEVVLVVHGGNSPQSHHTRQVVSRVLGELLCLTQGSGGT